VDKSVGHVLDVVVAARGSQVPIRVEVTLQVPIHSLGHSVASYVEFAALIQQGLLAVLLDDVAALLPIHMSHAHYLFDLTQLSANRDAAASVGVLSGLNDPDALAHVRILRQVRVVHGVVVGLFKLAELAVCYPIFDVECKRQVVKDVLVDGIIVHLHIVVNRLLVRQVVVVFLVVSRRAAVASMILFFRLF